MSGIRKLVALPAYLAESIERFRATRAAPTCPRCGQRVEDGRPPSESAALRELIEAGLLVHEAKRGEPTP